MTQQITSTRCRIGEKCGLGKIGVVIPSYNEAATIADIAERALVHAEVVVVVDDGSQDDTAALLEHSPVTVLRNPTNSGKGACLVRGALVALAQGVDMIVTLDGDGQHCPDDIPRLARRAERMPNHIIIAARTRERRSAPWARRFANRFADFWIAWAAGYPIRDSQSGFRLYPAQVFERVRVQHGRNRGFVFESEILIAAARRGWLSTWVDVDTIYPPHARPSHYRPVVDTIRIVRMVAWTLLRRGLHPIGLLRSLKLLDSPAQAPEPWRRNELSREERIGD